MLSKQFFYLLVIQNYYKICVLIFETHSHKNILIKHYIKLLTILQLCTGNQWNSVFKKINSSSFWTPNCIDTHIGSHVDMYYGSSWFHFVCLMYHLDFVYVEFMVKAVLHISVKVYKILQKVRRSKE